MKNLFLIIFTTFIVTSAFWLPQKPTTPPLGLYLPDDLEATLWAESPQLFNPTNMDCDYKGRIWVTEAVNYRDFNNKPDAFKHFEKGDRVMILEDTNQDGKCDKSTVFVQDSDLIAPLGIAVIGNKVVVSCAPKLIVYTDENGDDKPDKKEVLLTGFGGKDHDHSLHSVVVGPEGRWHFSVGNAGPHVVKDKSGWNLRSGSVYTGGSPYNTENQGNMKSDDGKTWVGGLQLSINPDGTGLKVEAHGFRNSYETCVDSYGDMWQNDNDDQVVTCRVSWLLPGGNAGYFSQDGTRYWQADHRPGQDMFTAHWHQEDPGVMPAGDCTGAGSPTGMAINEGDGLGEKYRGMVFSADAGRNAIFGYLPKVKGAGFDLGKRENIVISTPKDDESYYWFDEKHLNDNSKWFRPSDVMIGTDGALYIADWYDPVVGGHQMRDSTGFGRIYRITPKGKNLTTPKMDLSTLDGQIEAFKSPAPNVRAIGFQALLARGKDLLPIINRLLDLENPYHKARLVYLLPQLYNKLGNLKDNPINLKAIFQSKNETDLRYFMAFFRGLMPYLDDANLLKSVNDLANAAEPIHRREAALFIKNWPFAKKKDFLNTLFEKYEGEDPWEIEAIGQAVGKETDAAWDLYANNPKISEAVKMKLAWRLSSKKAIPQLKTWIEDNKNTLKIRKMLISGLAFINDKTAAETMLLLSKNTKLPNELSELIQYWLVFRQSNDWANYIEWNQTGIDLAKEKHKNEQKSLAQKLLNENIANWDRNSTAEYMALDSIGGQMLIGMISEKKLSADLQDVVAAKIFNNPDITIRMQAGKYFKRPGSGKVWVLSDIANLKGKVSKGKKIYENKCASCHVFKEQGNSVGPELTEIKGKFDKISLLDAIVNPNAAIVFGYDAWLINTKNNESYYGFLLGDGANLTLKDLQGKQHSLPTNSISTREKQTNSVMPAPDLLGMSERDLANLVAWLMK
jgi:putative membrane-bound dehydrogenase-like protein